MTNTLLIRQLRRNWTSRWENHNDKTARAW